MNSVEAIKPVTPNCEVKIRAKGNPMADVSTASFMLSLVLFWPFRKLLILKKPKAE